MKPEHGLPLRCPPFEPGGSKIFRAAIRPLVPNGAHVAAGDVFAYCQVRVLRNSTYGNYLDPTDSRDFQLVFAPRVSGRVYHEVSKGGWDSYFAAKPIDWDEPVGSIVPDEAVAGDRLVRVMWVAGRRPTDVAEQLSGLMSGWHDRVRAWWGDGNPPTQTVVCHEACDLLGVIRGEQRAFLDLFRECRGPVHIADYSDLLTPSSAVILSQLERSDEDCRAIADDIARGLGQVARLGAPRDVGAEALFLSAVLHHLTRTSPLRERHWVVASGGPRELPPARAVILSGGSELGTHYRHKRLGYVVAFPVFRIHEMPVGVKQWLRDSFEPIKRTVDAIEADLRRLAERLRELTGGEIVAANYVPNSASLVDGDTILMLSGLAREKTLRVIDVDALAADLGWKVHIADRAHPDAELEREMRSQILCTLRDMGLEGYEHADSGT